MNYKAAIQQLAQNKSLFYQLFNGVDQAAYRWKASPDKWCLLEVICHLYDEEREDFRARTKSVLETPEKKLVPFDPEAWVTDRKYMEQDYEQKLGQFLAERHQSVLWLQSLENPQWDNAYQHPIYGPLTAHHFLSNWLAHDYLHIRQATKLKYGYLQVESGNSLSYAGNWVL